MSKLRVGDVVVCVEGITIMSQPGEPETGGIYEVLAVDRRYICVDGGPEWRHTARSCKWFASRFERLGDVRDE